MSRGPALPRQTERTPNVFLIGAGTVASTLAGALRQRGVPVLGLWGRTPDAVRRAGATAGVAAFSAAPPDLILEADVLVLAVRDDAVAEVAAMLCTTGLVTRRHVLLKCSGARSAAETFGDVVDQVGGVGTLHPLRSIVEAREAARDLAGTLFGVEGDDAGRRAAGALVAALGGKAIRLDGGEMALYHAAASIASNYLIALADAAGEVLRAAGVAPEDAPRALVPLMRGTLDNLENAVAGPVAVGEEGAGLARALTGPVSRGDVGTVARHLAALDARLPDVAALYRHLGRRTVTIARRRAGADAAALDAIAARVEEPRRDS